MQRGSQHETDETVWATNGLRLGVAGLDLRQPSNPESLTRLLNARFIDDRTLRQREGHEAVLVRDGANLAALGDSYAVSDEWVYGHGARISSAAAAGWENAHHPFPRRGQATFNFDGTDVMFTGDRLLMVPSEEGSCKGQSTFWSRGDGSTRDYGIPAYLPLQVDSAPPASVSGDYVETCLTDTLRVYLHTETGGATDGHLTVWLVDRETGTVLHTSQLNGGTGGHPVDIRVINSAGLPVVLWRDTSDNRLYINHWNGTAWSGAATVVSEDVFAYDVAVVPGGFHLLWRTGAPSTVTLCAGYYTGHTKQSAPYVFGTALDLDGKTPNGPVALAVSESGEVGVLAEMSTGLFFKYHNRALAETINFTLLTSLTGWDNGISICSRYLKDTAGKTSWVFHYSRSAGNAVLVREYVGGLINPSVRYNSRLASKSFRVGDEVFCWLRSANAGTHYLIGGAGELQVCGYADREEAIVRATSNGTYGLPAVLPDPLDEDNAMFTWARPFNTGQTYHRGGNVRIGDIDFLPDVTHGRFGKCHYLSGSAVRAWDGITLGDAGFQDYPVISTATPSAEAGGGIALGARMYYRVYAVRYNARGERFQSAGNARGPTDAAADVFGNKVTLSIATLPDTNHSDVVFEVYRTENLGTTFYLVGTVANDLTAATVSFVDTMSDTDLIEQPADSHAAGVGALSELEEFGPLGCSILVVAGDRMWGAGGQVPSGNVQFSKLKEEGEGVGFDALAGFQTIDPAGHRVTSIASMNDFTVVFQDEQLHVIQGTGPDNYGRGSFNVPTITLADGASTHLGTTSTQAGVLYWGASGPRILTNAIQVVLVSQPVRDLAATMTPSGVVSSLSRQEVVWYTREGTALLMNYLGDTPRWAQWSGLKVAGCSQTALAMTDGRLFRESEDAVGDDGQRYEFAWATGNLRPEQVLQGFGVLRAVGVSGAFTGTHRLRMRIYYNGSPLWTDEWVWEPDANTWLASGTEHADRTPSEIDGDKPVDRSGAYVTHKRVTRQNCHYFRVAVSNFESDRPTYTPYEMSVELGARGGLGRVPVNTFS